MSFSTQGFSLSSPNISAIGKSINSGIPTHVTIGITDTLVLAGNTNRTHVVLVNDSTNTIYLAFNNTAVVGSGIRLNANGGSYEMSYPQGNLILGTVRAISTSASSNLTVQEDN